MITKRFGSFAKLPTIRELCQAPDSFAKSDQIGVNYVTSKRCVLRPGTKIRRMMNSLKAGVRHSLIKYSSSLDLSNRHQDIDQKEDFDRSYVLIDSMSTADQDVVSSKDRFSVTNFHCPVDFSKPPKRFWRISWAAITSKLIGKGMALSPINRMDL